MRQELNRQFKKLYLEYLSTHEEAGWIAQAIDDVVTGLNLRRKIRWDARHFLLLNMDQLVVQPLERSETSVENLQDLVRQDLRAILAKAAGEYRELSSHAVLQAASEIYDSMQCAGLWTDTW